MDGKIIAIIVIAALIVLALLYIASTYNSLIRKRKYKFPIDISFHLTG